MNMNMSILFHQYVCVFLSEWSSIHDSIICGTSYQVVKCENVYICILCTLHISNVTQSLSYTIWTKLNKILPESLFPNPSQG
jgi:hypothetical protein